MLKLLRFILIFLLFFLISFEGKSQTCAEIRASGLVYCNDASVVQLQAENLDGSCANVEWYSSSAIDVPLATGCDFTTPAVTGNVKYFVRDNTDQSQVINSGVGFDFSDTRLTNLVTDQYDGNIRTNFTPTQDFVLNTVEMRISNWGTLTPDSVLVEVRNYTDPTKSLIFNVKIPDGTAYVSGETILLDIGYNFVAYDNYDIAFGSNALQVFSYGGTAGVNLDYDDVFNPVINVSQSGPSDSRDNGVDGFGPFFNWDISAELGAGCPKKEVNLVQRCLEICDDGIDNDGDDEVDEACAAFSCDGKLLQSIGNEIFEMSVSPVEFNGIITFPFNINSMGYNPNDNKVYATIKNGADEAKIVRVAGDGTYQVLDELITKDGIELQDGYSADIGSNGIYYHLDNATNPDGTRTLYGFELVTLTEVSRVDIVLPSNVSDITYNPETGNIFGLPNLTPKKLLEIDPISGVVITYPELIYKDALGNTSIPNTGNAPVGGIYFLPNGRIIAYGGLLGANGNQNDMIQIDLETYKATGEVLVVEEDYGVIAQTNDGASCPYSLAVEKVANVVSVEAGQEIEYTIEVINNTGFVVANADIRDSISDYLTITEIVKNDFGDENIEAGTGVGTKDLKLSDVTIPIGVGEIILKVQVIDSICSDDVIFNQAVVSNLPLVLGEITYSDNPDTPAEQDATPVDLIGPDALVTPDITFNNPVCEGDTLILEELNIDTTIQWIGPNGFLSNSSIDTILNVSLDYSGEYIAFQPNYCPGDTARLTVSINPNPVANIEIPDELCEGDSLVLEGSSSISGSSANWIFNTSSLSSTSVFDPFAKPPDDDDYTLEVSSPAGCKDTAMVTVIVNDVPDVTIDPVTPICQGESMTLMSSSSVTGLSYSWVLNTTGLSATNVSSTIASPSSSQDYSLEVTSTDGCVDTAFVNLIVFEKPVASIATIDEICDGENMQLEASSSILTSDYKWIENTDGLSSISIFNPVASPLSTKEYFVEVSTLEGCKDTADITIVVNPNPIVLIDSVGPICEGESVMLEAKSTTLGLAYDWSLNSTGLSASNILDPVASPVTDQEYTVEVSTSKGCKGQDKFELIVNDQPEASIDPVLPICEGEMVQLVGSSTVLGVSYDWSANTVGLSSADVFNPSANPTSTQEYIMEVTTDEGCKDQTKVMLVVNDQPVVSIDPVLPICDGETTQLVGSSTVAGVTYDWSVNSVGLSDVGVFNPLANPSITQEYTLEISTVEGCKDEGKVTLVVNEQPVVSIDPVLPICEGDTSQLVANSTVALVEYEWVVNTVGLLSTNVFNPNASPSSTQEYTVEVSTMEGCKDDAKIELVVNNLPEVSLSSDATICKGESKVFVASGADSYAWSPDVGLDNSTTNSVISSSGSTVTYSVIGTTIDGCVDSDEVTLTVLDNPVPKVEIQYLKDICEGDQLEFSIKTSEHLGDSPVYNWLVLGSPTSQGNSSQLVLPNQFVAPTVFLEVVSNEMCVDPLNVKAVSNQETPQVYLYPDLKIEDEDVICSEKEVSLNVSDSKNVAQSFEWFDLNGGLVFSESGSELDLGSIDSEQYIRVFASENGCSDSDTIKVEKIDVSVDIRTSEDKLLLGDNTIISVSTNGTELTAYSDLDEGFVWDENLGSENRSPVETSVYVATATLGSCVATDSVEVVVLDPLNAPYFFSPNDDGENDTWIVKELDSYDDTRVTIFNRWGSKIVELGNKENVWNGLYEVGNSVPEGVYYYVIEGVAGRTDISLTGYVTVVK